MAVLLWFGFWVSLTLAAFMPPALAQEPPQDMQSLQTEVARLFQANRKDEALKLAEKFVARSEALHGPDDLQVAAALLLVGELNVVEKRYANAEQAITRSLAIAEKALGPNHPQVAILIGKLALVYPMQGRLDEAEGLLKRALKIFETVNGQDHATVDQPLSGLAMVYRLMGRYADAEKALDRAIALREGVFGPKDGRVAFAILELTHVYRAQARFDEAVPLAQRAVSIVEAAMGSDHEALLGPLTTLAGLLVDTGRLGEAEKLYERAEGIRTRTYGPDHPANAIPLANFGMFYVTQGRYDKAEALIKRSLALREKHFGLNHIDLTHSLNLLGTVYEKMGRRREAEQLLKRSLAILDRHEKNLDPFVLSTRYTALTNLGTLYLNQQRFDDAEPLLREAIGIQEKRFGPHHPGVAQALSNFSGVHAAKGRLMDAEAILVRSLRINETAFGGDHPRVASSLHNLAAVVGMQGRNADAIKYYDRALAIRKSTLGPDSSDVFDTLRNMAANTLQSRAAADRPDQALAQSEEYWRQATEILERRSARGVGADEGSDLERSQRQVFSNLVKASYHRRADGAAHQLPDAAQAMFLKAQAALASKTASTLAQMSVRSAGGSPALAALVRERQDLIGEWEKLDRSLVAARGLPPAKRNANWESTTSARLSAIDERLSAITSKLAEDFPDYAALSNPRPISVAEAQANLRDDEALVLTLDTDGSWSPIMPAETYVWVVTKTGIRWSQVHLGTSDLRQIVGRLRCGLDSTSWYEEGALDCAEYLGISLDSMPKPGAPLPFDVAGAHELYQALFGAATDLIKGKHLLIVPSGALTKLPFQVLVTAPPKPNTAMKEVAWLARGHAITVLPSVSALTSLRRVSKPTRAERPMIGFGNPLLDGADPKSERARRARAAQTCRETVLERVASLMGLRGGVAPVATRGGIADIAHLRQQSPLPETADELCAVARDLGADLRDLRLGAKATETEIKRLNATGDLARYRIVHFATHGTLAGQITGSTEPGLILTPPDTATTEDDGYLSGSEIASLKLDADWVILSACNTAGGSDDDNAEALSGLARVFFYAGARALLVSHWEVYSEATVKLITKAVRAIADDSVGRAEALRRSMLDMIDNGKPHEAHPSYWAPFVVVGEGAAAGQR